MKNNLQFDGVSFATNVKCGSYFEGNASRINTIESSSSANLNNMQDVKKLISGSYVEANNSTVEKINAQTTLKAEHSHFKTLTAGKEVHLYATSVSDKLNADSLIAQGGTLVSVKVKET